MFRNIGNTKSCRQIAGAFALAVCLGALPAMAAQNQNQEYQPPPADQGQYAQGGDPQGQFPYPGQPAYTAVPRTLTLPAGTVISVRSAQWLSSDRSRVGDQFNAVLDQPVIVEGWVVARRGQTVMGRVAISEKAGHGGKK